MSGIFRGEVEVWSGSLVPLGGCVATLSGLMPGWWSRSGGVCSRCFGAG